MNALTQKQVLKMRKQKRIDTLNYLQALACNIDYISQPLLSDVIQKNISMLESKLLYNEY